MARSRTLTSVPLREASVMLVSRTRIAARRQSVEAEAGEQRHLQRHEVLLVAQHPRVVAGRYPLLAEPLVLRLAVEAAGEGAQRLDGVQPLAAKGAGPVGLQRAFDLVGEL